MRIPDAVTGSILIGVGALAAYGGSLLPPVPGQQVGPNVFPVVVGAGLCFCGALIAVGVGRNIEAEAEADLAAHSDPLYAEAEGWDFAKLRALIPPALLLFYVAAADRLGFIITAAIMVFIVAMTLRASLKLALAVAVMAPPFLHLVFYKLLRVPLPEGLLAMPW